MHLFYPPKAKAKQSLRQPLHSYCRPVNQRWDAWHHSGVQALCGKSSWGRASNLLEGCPGLMDRNRGIRSSTTTYVRQAFASPGTHWCHSWVGCWHQATRSPFNSWVDWSNESKVSCTRKQQQTPKWLNWESNLGPFDYQADALTTWLCCLTHPLIHIHTHTPTHIYIHCDCTVCTCPIGGFYCIDCTWLYVLQA